MSTLLEPPREKQSQSEGAEPRSCKGTPTWEIARLFPRQGEWTEREYLALDTNQLVEFTHGTLEFLPMVTPQHQDIVLYLHGELSRHVKGRHPGRTYVAPLRVRIAPKVYREPDIVYVLPERIVDRRQPVESADLVMEVVSPGSEAAWRDREAKRGDYAAAGIKEYWIVDPETRTISVLVLEGTAYRTHGEFQDGTRAASVLLPGFEVDVKAVFDAGEGK